MIHLFNNFHPTSLTVTVRCHGNCWREEMTSPRFFCHLPTFISLSPPCRLLYQQITFTYAHVPKPEMHLTRGDSQYNPYHLTSAYFVMVKERLWIHDIKITFFSDMTPCNLADRYQCLGTKHCQRAGWYNGLVFWRCLVRIFVRTPENTDWGFSRFSTVSLCKFRISLRYFPSEFSSIIQSFYDPTIRRYTVKQLKATLNKPHRTEGTANLGYSTE
jgi:hypothetical protein